MVSELWFAFDRRLAFNPVKKETFQEGVNPDGTPHSKWKGYYYTVGNLFRHTGCCCAALSGTSGATPDVRMSIMGLKADGLRRCALAASFQK